MRDNDAYTSKEDSQLSAGEWLAEEKARLSRLGLISGERLRVHFASDPRKDTIDALGRFEAPEVMRDKCDTPPVSNPQKSS